MDSGMRAIPWYKSKIVVGVMISLFCKALVASGAVGEISGDTQKQLADIVITVLGGMGDLWALLARFKQTAAPVLTVTKQGAVEMHDKLSPQAEVPEWIRN